MSLATIIECAIKNQNKYNYPLEDFYVLPNQSINWLLKTYTTASKHTKIKSSLFAGGVLYAGIIKSLYSIDAKAIDINPFSITGQAYAIYLFNNYPRKTIEKALLIDKKGIFLSYSKEEFNEAANIFNEFTTTYTKLESSSLFKELFIVRERDGKYMKYTNPLINSCLVKTLSKNNIIPSFPEISYGNFLDIKETYDFISTNSIINKTALPKEKFVSNSLNLLNEGGILEITPVINDICTSNAKLILKSTTKTILSSERGCWGMKTHYYLLQKKENP